MATDNFFSIGFVRRVIGLKGEMGIQLDVDDPKRYKGLDALFLEDEPEHIPLFLVQAEVRGTELVIRAEGIDGPDAAKTMVGKTVLLPLAALPPLDEKRFYFHEIGGYEVFDERFGRVGIAEEVLDRMMQPLLRVLNGKEEVLLPLMKDAIIRIDRAKKQLFLKSPEGLIELYLGSTDEQPDDGE
jgi:16S rRNA processing protein RimM